jgi:hypothetical protein
MCARWFVLRALCGIWIAGDDGRVDLPALRLCMLRPGLWCEPQPRSRQSRSLGLLDRTFALSLNLACCVCDLAYFGKILQLTCCSRLQTGKPSPGAAAVTPRSDRDVSLLSGADLAMNQSHCQSLLVESDGGHTRLYRCDALLNRCYCSSSESSNAEKILCCVRVLMDFFRRSTFRARGYNTVSATAGQRLQRWGGGAHALRQASM